MFAGFATVSFYADDLSAARDWYTEVLGIQPYYAFPAPPADPAYIEFRVGDDEDEDELGFIQRGYAPPGASNAPGGAVLFWHVDDVPGTVQRLLDLGAATYEPVTERGTGFVTASVVDPFGNVLGVMHNPHYLQMVAGRQVGAGQA